MSWIIKKPNKTTLLLYVAITAISLPATATSQRENPTETALEKPNRAANTYSVESWWKGSRTPFSPQFNADGSVTLRVRNKKAKRIKVLIGEWNVTSYPLRLEHPTDGIWEITLENLPEGLHTYWFEIDGLRTIDIYNPTIKAGTQVYGSVLEIPASPPLFDQYRRNQPTGSDHIHYYYSKSLKQRRRFYVHTPPGYEFINPTETLPVLYLRHGGGDHAHSWLDDGKAGIILDNLVNNQQAEPMIIVMPECLTDGSWAGGSDKEGIQLLEQELYSVIMPFVETHYQIGKSSSATAIAGLSMGGGQAFLMGLNNPDRFAWIGEFSSGLLSAVEFDLNDRIPGIFNRTEEINRKIQLLYLACGQQDPRYVGHLEFAEKLESAGLNITFHDMGGAHEWKVWRTELRNLLQLLFQQNIHTVASK